MKKIRLTVDLSEEAYTLLEELQRGMEVSSKSDVIRLSLKAMLNVLRMEKVGWQFHVHRAGHIAPVPFFSFADAAASDPIAPPIDDDAPGLPATGTEDSRRRHMSGVARI